MPNAQNKRFKKNHPITLVVSRDETNTADKSVAIRQNVRTKKSTWIMIEYKVNAVDKFLKSEYPVNLDYADTGLWHFTTRSSIQTIFDNVKQVLLSSNGFVEIPNSEWRGGRHEKGFYFQKI